MSTTRYLIIGAGKAGTHAAETLRACDPSASVLLVGAEPHLPYERPPLSKELMLGESEPCDILVRPAAAYADKGIVLRLGTRVTGLDLQRQIAATDDQGAISFDRALLATGARPRPLPGLGDAGGKLFYLRTLDDALQLRSRLTKGLRLVIVGAGLIGLEIAAAAAVRGCRVVVVEQEPEVASRVLDGRVAKALQHLHERSGIQFLLGIKVEAMAERNGAVHLETSAGTTLVADAIVVGIGVIPNDEIAAEAGLDVDNGIRTDEFGRTSHPNVFAAGDVARSWNPAFQRHIRPESWQTAYSQGLAVAGNMAGANEAFIEVPSQWSSQFGHLLQCAGLAGECDASLESGDVGGLEGCIYHFRGQVLRSVQGFSSGRQVSAAKRLIASQVALPPASMAMPFDPVPLARAGTRG